MWYAFPLRLCQSKAADSGASLLLVKTGIPIFPVKCLRKLKKNYCSIAVTLDAEPNTLLSLLACPKQVWTNMVAYTIQKVTKFVPKATLSNDKLKKVYYVIYARVFNIWYMLKPLCHTSRQLPLQLLITFCMNYFWKKGKAIMWATEIGQLSVEQRLNILVRFSNKIQKSNRNRDEHGSFNLDSYSVHNFKMFRILEFLINFSSVLVNFGNTDTCY